MEHRSRVASADHWSGFSMKDDLNYLGKPYGLGDHVPYLRDLSDFSVEDDLDHLGKKYGLTYHIPYLRHFLASVDVKGKDVFEIGGALPREIVIDFLGCNSWTCTESPDYDIELGIEANQQTTLHHRLYDHRYQAILKNVEDLTDELPNKFDHIFSIACFEHIARLPQALAAMHRSLRPGGCLFSMFSPVWSCIRGHHLMHIDVPESCRQSDKSAHPIPEAYREFSEILLPWEHLLKTRYQLHTEISKRFDNDFADEVIYYVFNSPHINRYFTEDYMVMVYKSKFEVKQFDAIFRLAISAEMQGALEHSCKGYTMFDTQGIILRAAKT